MTWLLPEGVGVHRVCGRECTDGSPCQNMVHNPGEPCYLDGHRPEDPRVDGGPTHPSEVPLAGAGGTVAVVGVVVGKALAAIGVLSLGTGWFVSDLIIRGSGIALMVTLAIALDAYQRRALSDEPRQAR